MNMADIDWPRSLAPDSPDREAALRELRLFLLKGVRAGLSRRPGTGDDFLEDVVQTAMVRILDHLDRFEGRSAFTTWATAIALRVAFTELRRKHWNNVSLDELREKGAFLREEADSGPDPHESAARRSLITLLHQLIRSKLSPRQRDMLEAELNGMPHDEIAVQMRLTRNAVYKLGHDARRALRRALEAAGYGVEEVRNVLEGQEG
ncbi:MAG TPA: sigma-70 family RNA polymerase sigma factor [Candidatus Deferrimicrobiaceae bacterium]|nr:sigma-70 family RNA polymerase sigma factor [Candidatus Deferrimicrobiaceae bacterium]